MFLRHIAFFFIESGIPEHIPAWEGFLYISSPWEDVITSFIDLVPVTQVLGFLGKRIECYYSFNFYNF